MYVYDRYTEVQYSTYIIFLFSYTVHMTGDPKRGRKARQLKWTNKVPPTRKRGPEDIMSKPESLSVSAKEAKRTADLWGLFFTPTMLEKIVLYTNQKIQEDLDRNQYTAVQRRKRPHLKYVDVVCFPLSYILFSAPMFLPTLFSPSCDGYRTC
jgi:hypothetical protein